MNRESRRCAETVTSHAGEIIDLLPDTSIRDRGLQSVELHNNGDILQVFKQL